MDLFANDQSGSLIGAPAAGRGAKNADQPDGAADLGTCRQEQDGRNEGGRS
jgi:hypothetical protein